MNRLRIFNKAGEPPAPQNKHWYSLKASGEAEARSIEVYVYGEIGTWGITANQFVRDLAAIDDGVSPIVVAFNSIGGDLFDGLAIHNALSRLGERCTGRVDALAASAASVAVCGAHRVVIASNAMLMIHNPWTYASGDAEDLRKVATALDQAMEAIIAAYKTKAPDIDEVELRRLVNAETWLTASEAVALARNASPPLSPRSDTSPASSNTSKKSGAQRLPKPNTKAAKTWVTPWPATAPGTVAVA